MKNKIILAGSLLILSLSSFLILSSSMDIKDKKESATGEFSQKEFMEGDIIFQTSNSMQSKAIQIATDSKYSHVGIIMKYNGKLVVLEAVQPVKITSINSWIKHGEKGTYSLKRLKNREELLTANSLNKMRKQGKEWLGKNYDIAFDWSDKKLYCSELVWKIYKEGCGIEVGKLKKLKDYDLSHPIVKQALVQRYGDKIPLEEKMISPQAIFESDLLETVK